jgi:hypothetical protein
MLALVSAPQLEIFDPIIGPVAVDVMDALIIGQRTTEMPSHHKTMLQNSAGVAGANSHTLKFAARLDITGDIAAGSSLAPAFPEQVTRSSRSWSLR